MRQRLLFALLTFFSFYYTLIAQSVVYPETVDNPQYATRIDPITKSTGWISDVSIQNVGIINTDHLEFSPVYYENGIVYVTSQTEKGRIDQEIGEPFFELYYAEMNPAGIPIHPEPFSAKINSRLHEGPVAFGKNSREVFFTRNNIKNGNVDTGSKGVVRMKIFGGTKGKADWENIRELSFNSNEYSCIHPALSPDESKLYFSSNMPGGYGGYDLYVVERQGNRWGTPINLGSDINTSANEAFPFIHPSGALFFASKGHNSQGGYDVFLVNFKKTPTPPYKVKNLGTPFNTAADDLGFILHSEGKKGFFASNRNGSVGKDDIYQFDAPNGIPGVTTPEKLEALIAVYDNETNEMLTDVDVRVFALGTDGLVANNDYYDANIIANAESSDFTMELVRRPAIQMLTQNRYTDASGFMKTQLAMDKRYVIVAAKTGYSDNEKLLSTIDATGTITTRIGLNPVREIVKTEPVIETPPLPVLKKGSVIIADNVFYDFDKSAIRSGAARDLDGMLNILRRYPEMTIELAAHTDSRGDAAYNQQLSEARAASAKRYLVARGVANNRITTVGYGESRPRNRCVDGVKCTEVEHQYNRRTVMKVLTVGEPIDIEYYDNAPDRIDRAPKKVRQN